MQIWVHNYPRSFMCRIDHAQFTAQIRINNSPRSTRILAYASNRDKDTIMLFFSSISKHLLNVNNLKLSYVSSLSSPSFQNQYKQWIGREVRVSVLNQQFAFILISNHSGTCRCAEHHQRNLTSVNKRNCNSLWCSKLKPEGWLWYQHEE